jgi:hypothetical protein
MRRTRLTIATLSMAASAMVLGIPAATAATPHPGGNDQAKAEANQHATGDFAQAGRRRHHHHHRREHRRLSVRRHHNLRWHHRCGPGWDSGWVRGSDRDRFRDRDRFDRRRGDGGRDRDRDFRDDGDRGWGRGWISSCDWHRGEHRGEHRETSYAAPKGAVRAGKGGSVTSLNTPELAAGGSLAALGLAGAVGAMRRGTSSH